MPSPPLRSLHLACCLTLLAACAHEPSQPSAAGTSRANAGNPAWDAFVERFIEGYLASHPAFAVVEGRHEFDGALPDWSKEGLSEQIGWLGRQRARAERRRAR